MATSRIYIGWLPAFLNVSTNPSLSSGRRSLAVVGFSRDSKYQGHQKKIVLWIVLKKNVISIWDSLWSNPFHVLCLYYWKVSCVAASSWVMNHFCFFHLYNIEFRFSYGFVYVVDWSHPVNDESVSPSLVKWANSYPKHTFLQPVTIDVTPMQVDNTIVLSCFSPRAW